MNKKISKILSLTIALIVAMSMSACGSDEDDDHTDSDESNISEQVNMPSGKYNMTSVTSDGTTITYEQLVEASGPVDLYITFNEDGTGELQIFADGQPALPFTYNESQLHCDKSENYDEMIFLYSFDGTTVTINEGEASSFTFAK